MSYCLKCGRQLSQRQALCAECLDDPRPERPAGQTGFSPDDERCDERCDDRRGDGRGDWPDDWGAEGDGGAGDFEGAVRRGDECEDDGGGASAGAGGGATGGPSATELPRRAAIAHFQNGAEAGYFADELTRHTDVEAEVLARERFDAVHAVWSVDYVLLVDRHNAERAALTLQALVESTGDDAGDERLGEAAASDLPGGVWIPLILTLAAGSIACFGIERLDHRPRPPALVVGDRRDPPELWEIMAATRGTWVQTLDGGPGRRELTLDPDRRSARLKEDHDGDGRFDREWEFSWKRRR